MVEVQFVLCDECPTVQRLRDTLAAADELLLTLGAKRVADEPRTWEDLIERVEAREAERMEG
jgi:hypothetical protein